MPIKFLYPWQCGALVDWSIVGMNHYHVNGAKFLFVAMAKGDQFIKAEGHNPKHVFLKLSDQAVVKNLLKEK